MDAYSVANSTAKELVQFKWDSPYRWLASIAAIATLYSWSVGAHNWAENSTPITAVSKFFNIFGAMPVIGWLDGANNWAVGHLNNLFVGNACAVAIFFGIISIYWGESTVDESRSAATIWLAVSVLAYSPDAVGVAILVAILAIALTLTLVGFGERSFGVTTWLSFSMVNMVVAAFWLPINFGLWAFARDSTHVKRLS
ncbi:hypothetical protein [Rathayibacter toxicus]|uniref:Uncharacterized protein n=1 Tax=Rathayibacter toxicus TaxID=145458 RepID=A0A0C5BU68_9MICO|nr:hypothetical protein [Rathayibacter toxicus]AJM78212.1 hypothetical protein TI83_10300 [Rathayibacter toxicus]ALS57504.1 hypothetical protein APU90_06765 [Rathayibacter toxicus]KKM46792.1 hypothetical protein VT73_01940 [Rathayibacter toxicus]QOD08537.1 hypothetical protein AYW78_01265 [Rathayibacter toxicus]QOD10642.1 hypothetical protein BSG36_01200 [Rathayibacter toxicus]